MPRFLGFGKSNGGSDSRSAQSNYLTTPRERKRDRLFSFLKPHSRSPTPSPSSSAIQHRPSLNTSSLVSQRAPSPNPYISVIQPAPSPHLPSSGVQQGRSPNTSSLVSQRAPSPNPPTTILQQALPHIPSSSESTNLWAKAYDKLPDELKKHLTVDKPGATHELQTLRNVLQTAIQAKEANMAKRIKLKWGDKEIDVQDTADRLVALISKFKEVGDIAVQYDPIHAALPWAGVRFILLLFVGNQEKLAAAMVGAERVALLIGRCAIYEQLYLIDDIPKNANEATENLFQGLLILYTAILQLLCRLIRVFQGKLVDKLKTPESTLEEIKAMDEPESAVNAAVIAVENCCTRPRTHYAFKFTFVTRQHDLQIIQPHVNISKLRELLKHFMPVFARIDKNVDEIYNNIEDIEENQRMTILQWFSTVPYQSHHDLACEGRVEHTGAWLFKRKEFTSWENSRAPAILWLHGIPGAGKTKLVSATIEYLNGIRKFDKVAYFYCKRDEPDRRDREKIILSLIKQLACPPIDKTSKPTRICAEALEAYNKEQEDPASRNQLNFDSSLNLLGHQVEY
ncbi:hypothetical protein BGX38DRAFT_1259584 [Terfezia claveryi]|nr:hypothetical protein BGX38DRAFT_1259584 [Terfezia claveryi]